MRKLVALLCAVMVLGWCGVASGAIYDAVNQMHNLGLESSAEVNQTYINLSNVSNGTVTSVTYCGANQERTDNTHTVVSQTYSYAHNKIAQFVLDLNIRYSPDTSLGISGLSDDMTVSIYTYGTMKNEVTYAIVSGLVDCLGNPPIVVGNHDNGDSSSFWIDSYTPTAMASKIITSFKIGNNTYTTSSETTSSGSTQIMDVAPYEKDGQNYTPVRYIAYACGVSEDGVQWNGATQTVTITKDDITLKLTIGSTTLTNNSEIIIMDAAPELVDPPGRTMLPAKWVSEALGASVTWDEVTQQLIIEIDEQGQ